MRSQSRGPGDHDRSESQSKIDWQEAGGLHLGQESPGGGRRPCDTAQWRWRDGSVKVGNSRPINVCATSPARPNKPRRSETVNPTPIDSEFSGTGGTELSNEVRGLSPLGD